jgi:carboxyl-terminal processing protease
MRSKFRIALLAVPVLVGLTAYTFLGSRCAAAFNTDEEVKKDGVIMESMLRVLRNTHYRPVEIDDNYSHKVFDTYLKRNDFNKKIFLQSDVDALKSKYYGQIDDEVKGETFVFFDETVSIINERVKEDKQYYTEILSKPFDFTVKESVELDPDKLGYPKDKAEMKESWRLFLKYQVMVRFVELKNEQKKAIEEKKPNFIEKADSTLEREARLKVLKTENDIFDRLSKVDRDDRMSIYLNVVTGIYDPHTEFFPPADKASFDIQMTGQLEGIGATLQEKDGYIKVTSIVPGSPSWKQGQLKPGDLILKVGQGDKEPIDIVGMRVDEAVKHIRGKKGTEVRLTVQKPDGSTIVIPIIRDVVILEETFAQSAIIDQQKKIGYIRLPSFYGNFSRNEAGHTCSEDIRKEIQKLKAEKVSGIILDVRDNGGGLLMEVCKMMGLFIPEGPVVQVKTRAQGVNIYDDRDDGSIVYDGPLVVLINENSASASEILAAAVQDYKRGVIVGSSASTFGKGTVQNFYDLDEFATRGDNSMKPLGQVKVTIQKFYRVNGGSTQLKGVVPEVQLPGYYSFDEQGEKDLDYPMEWDQIPPAPYKVWKDAPAYDKLKTASAARIAKNQYFQLIAQKSSQLKRERDNSRESLYLPDYMASRDKITEENKQFKPLEEPIKGMTVLMLDSDKKAINGDTSKLARKNDFLGKLQKDPYISEAANIIREMK